MKQEFYGLVFRVYDGIDTDNFYSERIIQLTLADAMKLLEAQSVQDSERV